MNIIFLTIIAKLLNSWRNKVLNFFTNIICSYWDNWDWRLSESLQHDRRCIRFSNGYSPKCKKILIFLWPTMRTWSRFNFQAAGTNSEYLKSWSSPNWMLNYFWKSIIIIKHNGIYRTVFCFLFIIFLTYCIIFLYKSLDLNVVFFQLRKTI